MPGGGETRDTKTKGKRSSTTPSRTYIVLKITGIGDVVRSKTELIDVSDALIQREFYPLYIMLKEQPLPRRSGAPDRSPRSEFP